LKELKWGDIRRAKVMNFSLLGGYLLIKIGNKVFRVYYTSIDEVKRKEQDYKDTMRLKP
jgi:hypothetical protein